MNELTTSYDRRLTAIHEAGHAAVAMHVGIGIRRVTIAPTGAAQGKASHYPIGKWFQPDIEVTTRTRTRIERSIMVFWAGTLAEELIGGRAEPDGATHDRDMIVQLATFICGDPEETSAYIEWLRLRCRNLLQTPLVRRAVDAITDALVERTTLRGTEIRAVVSDSLLDADALERFSNVTR